MNRRIKSPIVGGNWKMYNTMSQSLDYVRRLRSLLEDEEQTRAFVLMPFTVLYAVKTLMAQINCRVSIGAQDAFWEDRGAYTGEVSSAMLSEVGCKFVLLGHCERRRFFFETDETVNRKARAALRHALTPIICIGETLVERETGQTEEKIHRQVAATLDGLTATEVQQCIIAYEPIWAIGTDQTPRVERVEEVHSLIRALLKQKYYDEAGQSIRIIYGGSVHLDNCVELARGENVDGLFVGRDSLDPVTFAQIIRAACAGTSG